MNVLITGTASAVAAQLACTLQLNGNEVTWLKYIDDECTCSNEKVCTVTGSWLIQNDLYNALLAQDAFVLTFEGEEFTRSPITFHIACYLKEILLDTGVSKVVLVRENNLEDGASHSDLYSELRGIEGEGLQVFVSEYVFSGPGSDIQLSMTFT
jgi:hypothetical protein